MVIEPLEIAVTAPVELLIVATAGLLEVQVPPSEVEANTVFSPTQSSSTPLKVPASANGVTVMDWVSKSSAHPPLPETV